ncbi:MAG: hypothetical protein HY656_01955 [Acidobacteria bacterium]|nr:hypothetical protein [Acidobacteriota bacterium]
MNASFEPAPLHPEGPSGSWQLPLIVAAVLGLGVLGGILWLGRSGSEPVAQPAPLELPPLNAEAEAYIPQIEIAGLDLSRWQNFLGQQVTYLDIRVTNHGARSILVLELTIEFLDPYQAVVLRDTLRAIGARPLPGRPAGPLGPGQTRSVRAAFEHIPADWNGLPPRVQVTGLLLR